VIYKRMSSINSNSKSDRQENQTNLSSQPFCHFCSWTFSMQ